MNRVGGVQFAIAYHGIKALGFLIRLLWNTLHPTLSPNLYALDEETPSREIQSHILAVYELWMQSRN